MIYVILSVIIAALVILLFVKHNVDLSKEYALKEAIRIDIEKLQIQKEQLGDVLQQRDEAIQRANRDYQNLIERYTKESVEKRDELARLESDRKEELARDYEVLLAAKRELYHREIQDLEREREEEWEQILQAHILNCQNLDKLESQLVAAIESKRSDYENLIAPMQLLDQQQQEKYFWCIQVPEVEHQDISFLLTTVAPQVRNKDIIPKLVWSEYLQKPTQELMKRAKIEDKSGIYKITHITTGKCYIGKSTKVRQRLIDHIKGAVGITSIADQRIHHAMLEEGLWNWTFECICECDKAQLNEKEKYYIEFFNSTNYGYNIRSGG